MLGDSRDINDRVLQADNAAELAEPELSVVSQHPVNLYDRRCIIGD